MKSGFFLKILDTQTIELEESFYDTVDRLQAQSGKCYETDSNGIPLSFFCSNKGKMYVDNTYRRSSALDRIYCVRGEVTEMGEKTIVSIYTIEDRSAIFFRWVAILLYCALLAAFVAVSLFSNAFTQAKAIITVVMLVGLIAMILSRTRTEEVSKPADVEIMKNVILSRVNAVKRWND